MKNIVVKELITVAKTLIADDRQDTVEFAQSTIQLIGQALGRGFSGVLAYVGAKKPQASYDGSKYGKNISYSFFVNGKKGEGWYIRIEYNYGHDLFDVSLNRKNGIALSVKTLVDIDNLKKTVERMYDDAIREYNNGFINI